MYQNHMKVSFKSVSENEGFGRIAVASFVSILDPTMDVLSDIKTAVSEAVTNSIIHGYGNNDGIVTIECFIVDREVEIIIRDQGQGIENIEMAKTPLYTSRPDLERSGMGFTVMETFMDYLEIVSEQGKGTSIIMKKLIN